MNKMFPVIAVTAITSSLITLALTQGIGPIVRATTSTETCFSKRPGSVEFRQCQDDLKDTCDDQYTIGSDEFRGCMKNGMGTKPVMSAGSASSRPPRPSSLGSNASRPPRPMPGSRGMMKRPPRPSTSSSSSAAL